LEGIIFSDDHDYDDDYDIFINFLQLHDVNVNFNDIKLIMFIDEFIYVIDEFVYVIDECVYVIDEFIYVIDECVYVIVIVMI
jgi:hypothetical protein